MIHSCFGVLLKEKTISKAWERAVLETWNYGEDVLTEYEEISKEVLGLLLVVEEPFLEKRVHLGDVNVAVKGSLESYCDEVIKGTLDNAVRDGKIPYTYHNRLFSYPPKAVDQINFMVRKLQEANYSRRAQAITWDPEKDLWVVSPPCLQRVWCTIRDNALVMHTTWRSRDIFRAMHMNMLAMTELQKVLAKKLKVKVGAYFDYTNSGHIYENSFGDVERFIHIVKKRSREG